MKEKGVILKNKNNFIALFNQYFEVIPADTPKRLLQSHQLRYRVYCQEGRIIGFNPNDYPEELEFDRYDDRAVHSLLIHKASGHVAGTVRLILPISGNPDAKFPVENHVGDALLSRQVFLEKGFSRSRVGEISRLIIAPEFRMRKGENLSVHGLVDNTDHLQQEGTQQQGLASGESQDLKDTGIYHRQFPHTILGLFVAIVRMSAENGLSHWYAGMEPILARLLRGFGVYFEPISPIMDYYGPCRCYFGNILEVMEGIYRTNIELWELLTDKGAFFPRTTQ